MACIHTTIMTRDFELILYMLFAVGAAEGFLLLSEVRRKEGSGEAAQITRPLRSPGRDLPRTRLVRRSWFWG